MAEPEEIGSESIVYIAGVPCVATLEAVEGDPKGLIRQIWKEGQRLKEHQEYIQSVLERGMPDRARELLREDASVNRTVYGEGVIYSVSDKKVGDPVFLIKEESEAKG